MRRIISLPLLVIALTALASSLQVACSSGPADSVSNEDALGGYGGYSGYGG